MKEIPALAKIGVDVMQIDDGWQKGEGRYNEAKGFIPNIKTDGRILKLKQINTDLDLDCG